MEKTATLNKWLSQMENNFSSSSLYAIDLNYKNNVRIMEENFISLFNSLVEGETFKIVNIEKTSSSESYDINQYRRSSEYTGKELFTNLGIEEQLYKLESIYHSSSFSSEHTSVSNTYLCFGLLKYKLNVLINEYSEAPLVLVPVELSYNEEENTYLITGSKNEVLLNTPLLEKMQKERKLDLDYPIDASFSISNFLYYIGVKVKPLNWHVSNVVLLSNLDLPQYYTIKSIKNNEEKIVENKFFKKIAYPNAEFYSFTERPTRLLESKFLSILEMENEEHSILKKVINKERMVIETPSQEVQSHLISNIALSYILNNQKVLIVYSNKKQKDSLLEEIDNQGFMKYTADLNPQTLDKRRLLIDILGYDNYQIPYKEAKTTIVNENLNKYYGYKNDFKRLLNALRTTKNHIGTSVNKVVNEYYRLSNFPLIDIEISDANRYSKDTLSLVLTQIKVLSDSIENLNGDIKDHPFHGLSKKQMYKEDYIPLKNAAISLTTHLDDVAILFKYANEKYQLPVPYTLKEFKALLNILSFASDYPHLNEWIDIEDLDGIYDTLVEVLKEINELNTIRYNLIDAYTRRVGFLKEELITQCYDVKKGKKARKKVRRLLGTHLSLDDVNFVINALNDYYCRTQNAKDRVKDIDPTLVEFMHKNKLKELREIINSINFYKNNLKYIKEHEGFDIHAHLNQKQHDRLMLRRSLQTIFNDILKHQIILQEYFDPSIFDFTTLPFDVFTNKVKQMSKEFTRINDYTSYYISLFKVNKTIPNLGNELIKAGKNTDFEKIFLRRFYHDFLVSTLHTNPTFKDYSKETIYNQLKNFTSTNTKRKAMIEDILTNYINNYLRKNVNMLRNEESKPMSVILRKGTNILPLSTITNTVSNSLFNLKPCVMIPYTYVGQLLENDVYSYDAIIYMSDKEMVINDALSSLSKGRTLMVFDHKFISTNPVEKLEKKDENLYSFISNAKQALPVETVNIENKIIPLNGNFYDIPVKEYICNRLVQFGFESRIDRAKEGNTIDILARVPNTKTAVAIVIDHLSYNSPESAHNNIEKENKVIKELGYIPYRIFPSTYFANEEQEQNELNNFIVKASKLVPEPNVKKNTILLMDHLFPLFKDPHIVYYELDKSKLSVKEVVSEMIKLCAPISVDELDLIVKENTKEIVKKLELKKEIVIEDNFIYLPDQKVQFRRVNREESFYRPIEYVSQKELYEAVFNVVNHCSNIEKDTLIKMILLSLGYKKINDILYKFVEDAIIFLLDKKVIFIEDDNIIYRDLEN